MLEKLNYKSRLKKVDDAIIANAKFLDDLVADPEIFSQGLGEGKLKSGQALASICLRYYLQTISAHQKPRMNMRILMDQELIRIPMGPHRKSVPQTWIWINFEAR